MRLRRACLDDCLGRRVATMVLVVLALPCLATLRGSELRRTPLVQAVERARPSVVNIHGEKTLAGSDSASTAQDARRRVNGMGTGVVIDPRGYIVTNHHVVDGVRKIMVTTVDRENYVATLIAHDPKTDLAIIKVDASQKLPVIEIGSSGDLMPGETVVAVGNAFGYEHTVTRGIVSALHRTVQVSDSQNYEDLIQTDASINPGNSGGPLLNIDGEMIGINVAVRAGAQGIGFAIPIDKVMTVTADLLSARHCGRVWHGLVIDAQADGAVVVKSVEDDSPAAAGGLKAGDRITSVGDVAVRRRLDVERVLLDATPGDNVELSVQRDAEQLSLELVLAEAPKRPQSPEQRAWDVLGLRLDVMQARQFAQYQTRYRGGLAVTDVRPDSPAYRQGIRRGDVLVGMHIWETISLDNVAYVLDRPDFDQFEPLKFYILRGNETLYGHLTVSHRSKPNP